MKEVGYRISFMQITKKTRVDEKQFRTFFSHLKIIAQSTIKSKQERKEKKRK